MRSRFVPRTLAQVAAIPRGAASAARCSSSCTAAAATRRSPTPTARSSPHSTGSARAPIVVFPNGGESSYFHKRADGDWGDARLWLDGGTADPFRQGGEALAAALGIGMRHWTGEHEGDYWRAHFGTYLRFYADALAGC